MCLINVNLQLEVYGRLVLYRRWGSDCYLVVSNVLEGVGHHADAHVDQIGGRHLEHRLRKLLTIFVDFLCTNTYISDENHLSKYNDAQVFSITHTLSTVE